jgi:acetate kinase
MSNGPDVAERRILVMNGGSSSLKSAVYEVEGNTTRRRLGASIDRIGLETSALRVTGPAGEPVDGCEEPIPDLRQAANAWLDWLTRRGEAEAIDLVGHRIVHGGALGDRPRVLETEIVAALRALVPLDPDHLPGELDIIEVVGGALPGRPQVACFDTAFHWHMPDEARQYALPRGLRDRGYVRYGFHGLSYEYLMGALRGVAGARADGCVVLAHLGSGASLAAVRGGVSVDTTMGMTPTGGIMMGTRCGDLDPGVMLRLLEDDQLDAEALRTLINHRSGLLGVSGRSSDMQELLARRVEDPQAAEAVTLFCYLARKALGALIAALGGLEVLVFSGGIGTHAPAVRAAICEPLGFAGVTIDEAANRAGAAIISRPGAPVDVRVMATDEEIVIARQTAGGWDAHRPGV